MNRKNREEDERDEPMEVRQVKDGGADKTELQESLTDPDKSALKKYQDLVVGLPGLWPLMKHEFLTTFLGSLPGAIGLAARQQLYKSLFGRVGRGVVIGKSVTIRHGHKIRLGNNVVIDDYAVLDAKGTGNKGIVIGDNVMIGRGTVISCKNGDIFIGDNTNIAIQCFIQSARQVTIGKNNLFSAYCYLIGGGDHKTDRTDVPIIAQSQVVRGITLEDNCLLGAGVKIQDGVHIERDAIVGTGAVVRDNICAFGVAVGIPAKVVKRRDGKGNVTAPTSGET
ncbi:MAG: acyltransferase [bacterium]|nr:acyltransferase [bacterium]